MAKNNELILDSDEEMSKPFNLDGLHQILCKMPPGIDWGNSGDRIVTLEAKSPHPPITTNYDLNIAAPNTGYLEGSGVYTRTGDDLVSILPSTGGELKFSVDEDINHGLFIDFGPLGNLLNPVEVKNNTGEVQSPPDTELRLGEVFHNGFHIGTWLSQTNPNEGPEFRYETDSVTTDLNRFGMTFRDEYYSDENQISLSSGALPFQIDPNTNQGELIIEPRTNIGGFRISATTSGSWTFRNTNSDGFLTIFNSMSVYVNGELVGDLLVDSYSISLAANGTRTVSVSDNDFSGFTYNGNLSPADRITIGMHDSPLAGGVDINFDGLEIEIIGFTTDPTGAVDTDITFQNEVFDGDDSYFLQNAEASAFEAVDSNDESVQIRALADMTNVVLTAVPGQFIRVSNNTGSRATGTWDELSVSVGSTNYGNLADISDPTFALNSGFHVTPTGGTDITYGSVTIDSIDEGDIIEIGTDWGVFGVNYNGLRIDITADDIPGALETEKTYHFSSGDLGLTVNQVIEIPALQASDEVSIRFRTRSLDKDDISFQFGRSLSIRVHGESDTEDDWFEVEDPITRDTIIYWDGPGFQEIEGSEDILYRLSTTQAGCRASKHQVRRWMSSRPGR